MCPQIMVFCWKASELLRNCTPIKFSGKRIARGLGRVLSGDSFQRFLGQYFAAHSEGRPLEFHRTPSFCVTRQRGNYPWGGGSTKVFGTRRQNGITLSYARLSSWIILSLG